MLKKIGSMLSFSLCLMALILTPDSAFSDDYQISLLVSRKTVHVGEEFYVQLEVKGTSQDIPAPKIPDFDGLDFFAGGTTSSFQFINGQMQSSKTFTYSVFARKEGTFNLDGIQIEIDGKVYKPQAATVTVQPTASQPGGITQQPGQPHATQGQPSPQETPQSPPTEVILLKANPETTSVYANEGIVLQYILYKHPQVQLGGSIHFENLQSTLFQGFWQEEVQMQPRNVGTQNIGDHTYDVIELKKYVLFPIKPGQLRIEPVSLVCQVVVQNTSRQRRSGSPLDGFLDDNFFDGFFGRSLRNIRLLSNPVHVEVMPLPDAGRPDGFTGAVGKFRLSAELDKTDVMQGSAIRLSVSLEGEGNLRTIADPDLPDLDGFEQFEGTRKESIRITERGMTGAIEYEFVLIPKRSDIGEIGPIQFSYFDPETRRYEQIQTRPIPLLVRPRESTQEEAVMVSGRRHRAIKMEGEDFRHIATDIGTLKDHGGILLTSPAFIGAVALPWCLVMGTWVWRRRKESMDADPIGTRRKKAGTQALRALKQIEAMIHKDPVASCAALEEALYRYLGDRFTMEARGLTSEQLVEKLLALGMNEVLARDCGALLRSLEDFRYSPVRGETQVDGLCQQTKSIIERTERT